MQHRMKEFTMSKEAIDNMLERSKVGRISTLGADGYPYCVAVHFVADSGKIYFHGLKQGEKITNILSNPKVCFEVDEYIALQADNLRNPCDADAEYESIVIRGNAKIMEDFDEKKAVLTKIITKYAPELLSLEMPEARIKGTAVVEIEIHNITGKYHK